MARDVHLTPEGLAEIKRELDELVNVRRPYISDKIKSAREFGDLSENFEYHSAKNEQGFIEARIAELEAIVKNAVVMESPTATGEVQRLSTVRFVEEGGPEEVYRIVGPAEADPTAGRISWESAIGEALMGHKVGDEVEVEMPNGGSYTVRITSVE
jgi:transcription elongation factor GreA